MTREERELPMHQSKLSGVLASLAKINCLTRRGREAGAGKERNVKEHIEIDTAHLAAKE